MKDYIKLLAATMVSTLICCLLFWLLVIRKEIVKAQFELVTSNTQYIKDTTTYKAVVNNYYANTHPVKVIEVPVPKDADTAAILSAYFAKHIYLRSFEDSLVKWNLLDTVSKNAFGANSLWTYTIKRPQAIITTTYAPVAKRFIYVGMRGTYDGKLDFAPVAGIALKNKWLFDASYNFGSKRVSAGAYYKLGK